MSSIIVKLLQNSLFMSAAILLLMVLSRLFHKKTSPGLRMACWLAVALSLLIPARPPLYTLTVPEFMSSIAEPAAVRPERQIEPQIEPPPLTEWSGLPEQTPDEIPMLTEPIYTPADSGAVSAEPLTTQTPINVFELIPYIWALGFLMVVAICVMKHIWLLRTLKRWGQPVSGETLALLEQVRHEIGLKRRIRLFASPVIATPVLIGLFRPAIILPGQAIEDSKLRFILMHEALHCKRGDVWAKALSLLTLAAHWFNPFVYLMNRALTIESEAACDRTVLRHAGPDARFQYSETVLYIAQRCKRAKTLLSSAFNSSGKSLKQRLNDIVERAAPKRWVSVSCATALIVGLLLPIGLTGFTVQPDGESAIRDLSGLDPFGLTPSRTEDAYGFSNGEITARDLFGQEIFRQVPGDQVPGDDLPDFSNGLSILDVDFSDENIAELTAAGFMINLNGGVEGNIVKGEASRSGDASFKAAHIPGTSYTSMQNSICLGLGTPVPKNMAYRISAWFYVPEEGNTEGKTDIAGPGVVINGKTGYDHYKFPASVESAGTIRYDEWVNVTFYSGTIDEEVEHVCFRFYTNDAETHPEVWYLDDISVVAVEGAVVEVEDLPGLKDIYKDYFLLGTAGNLNALQGSHLELAKRHFGVFTMKNDLKPELVQKEEGRFTFAGADGLARQALAADIAVIGHTLVWHQQTPDWMWDSREKAKERLEAHVEAVIRNSGPYLTAVEVVNEAFAGYVYGTDWRDGLRQDDGWYTVLGEDFIEIAFRKADQVRREIGRPDLKLYYNDFNLNIPNKAYAVYNMVTELRAKGVPIDGIGMQSHYRQDLSPDSVRRSLDLFKSIPGIEVSITGLNIVMLNATGNVSLTAEEDARQGRLYAELFSLYKEYAMGPANPDLSKRLIARVTVWGTADNTSGHPLLFDRQFKAKGAYYAVADPEGYLERLAVAGG